MSGEQRRLQIVDYARFAAAFAVVGYHYLFNGIANGKVVSITASPVGDVAKYGYLGVDLFFLVSGFVIAGSARGKTASAFAVGRAVRLYPAYVVAMTITTLVTVAMASPLFTVTGRQYAANLTMVSVLLGQPYVDGAYWTLLYELAFYVAVFLLLLARQGRHLEAVMPVWALLMLAVSVAAPGLSGAPFLGGYYALFASGAVIASIRRSGWTPLRAAGLLAGAATAIPYEVRVAGQIEGARHTDLSGWVVAAISASFFLLLLATLNRRVASLRLPGSKAAGGLTYPLYLLHAHIGYLLLGRFATDDNKWVVYPLVVAVVVSLAWALHHVVEVRYDRVWRRIFDATLGTAVRAVERVTTPRHSTGTPERQPSQHASR